MDASESKTEQKHWPVRFVLSKTFLIAAAIVVAYTLAGFFLAPYLLKRQATRFAEETLKCSLAIEEVRVNPYALTLEIKNLDLKERNGSPLLAFKEFFINFQVSSLWKWALAFADVRLESPSVHVEMKPGGRLNLIEVVDRIPKNEKEKGAPSEGKVDEKEPPLRIILEHIALNQGRVVFTDRSDSTHAGVTFEPLGLELRNFTTLPDKKGKHHIEASLPRGGKLTWMGQASLHPLWSEGSIEVEDFEVITAWEFLQDELLLDKPEGGVDLTAQYRFAHDGISPALVVDGLKVLVSGLSLKAQGEDAPIFSMETIRLEQGRFDLATRELSVGQLALSRGIAAPGVNAQGRLNFQDLVKAAPDSRLAAAEKQATGAAPWRIDLKAVSLDDLAVNYTDRSRLYPIEIGATRLGVKLRANLSYAREDVQVFAEDLGVTVSGVGLKEAGKEEPMVALDLLTVEGGRLDLGARQVRLERVRLEGGHVEALMEKEGQINFERMLAEETTGKIKKEIAEAGEEAKAEGRPWSVAVGAVEAAGFSVAFIDQTLSPSPTLNLENIALKLSDIHSEGMTPIPFEASLDVKQGGNVKTKGLFTPAEKNAEATLQVSNLSLMPVQPYVAKVALLTVESGAFSLAGQVNHREGAMGPQTAFNGNAEILNLLVNEAETGQRFLAWKSMKVGDIKMSLGPDRVEIGEVRLSEPYGKLIIYEDQSVNLKKVLRDQGQETGEAKPAPKTESGEKLPVNLRRIRIDRGRIEPFDAKRFTDVSMIFRNVEMTNLTPYSAKFAGYRIASGKLSLDLRYLIKQSELKGENQIILEKLTLGEKLDNPDAPNIPLELALALLKDADDRIDIGLPVSGNLDDPQFSYGHLIWKALLNLFTKIITAPFRALGAMLGVEEEDLGTVIFDRGEAELSPPEQEKMKALSEALAKRPQLRLKIEGRYDSAGDGEAMKAYAVRHEIAKRIGREPAPGEKPEPVDVANPQIQQAIEDLVRERISPEALAAAKEEALKQAAELGKEAENEAKKEDKAAPPALSADQSRELYTALLRRVMEVQPVTEGELQDLGRERAKAIKQELVTKGKIAEGRLIVLEPSKAEEKSEEAVASTLTLDVAR